MMRICREKRHASTFEPVQVIHEEAAGKYVLLRELMTGKTTRAISPAGYLGEPGQIWYAQDYA